MAGQQSHAGESLGASHHLSQPQTLLLIVCHNSPTQKKTNFKTDPAYPGMASSWHCWGNGDVYPHHL